jgi:hypothetical protein
MKINYFLFLNANDEYHPFEIQSDILLSLFPLFLPWGLSVENDLDIINSLSLPGPPALGLSYAIGNQTPQSITLSLPSSSYGINALCLTHQLSSVLTISTMAMLDSVMCSSGMQQNESKEWGRFIEKQFLSFCNLVKTFPPWILTNLPNYHPHITYKFKSPSLSFVSIFWNNPSRFIHVSFTYLLHSLIESATKQQRELNAPASAKNGATPMSSQRRHARAERL